ELVELRAEGAGERLAGLRRAERERGRRARRDLDRVGRAVEAEEGLARRVEVGGWLLHLSGRVRRDEEHRLRRVRTERARADRDEAGGRAREAALAGVEDRRV